MRWTQVNNCWECVFVNVPFYVKVVQGKYKVESRLHFVSPIPSTILTTSEYDSVEDAKSDVNNFVMNHLALYSAQVHRECLGANVMTWRKLREQLDQIPEDQLDEAINHLDTDGYWVGEPRIELADEDQYAEIDDFKDVTGNVVNPKDYSLVVEKGKYFLSTCQV